METYILAYEQNNELYMDYSLERKSMLSKLTEYMIESDLTVKSVCKITNGNKMVKLEPIMAFNQLSFHEIEKISTGEITEGKYFLIYKDENNEDLQVFILDDEKSVISSYYSNLESSRFKLLHLFKVSKDLSKFEGLKIDIENFKFKLSPWVPEKEIDLVFKRN